MVENKLIKFQTILQLLFGFCLYGMGPEHEATEYTKHPTKLIPKDVKLFNKWRNRNFVFDPQRNYEERFQSIGIVIKEEFPSVKTVSFV